MKCAIVIADGLKQIMFTPETQNEKDALGMITPEDNISIDIKTGSFYTDMPPSAAGYCVSESNGGYLRAYECRESLMLVLRPKANKEKNVKGN